MASSLVIFVIVALLLSPLLRLFAKQVDHWLQRVPIFIAWVASGAVPSADRKTRFKEWAEHLVDEREGRAAPGQAGSGPLLGWLSDMGFALSMCVKAPKVASIVAQGREPWRLVKGGVSGGLGLILSVAVVYDVSIIDSQATATDEVAFLALAWFFLATSVALFAEGAWPRRVLEVLTTIVAPITAGTFLVLGAGMGGGNDTASSVLFGYAPGVGLIVGAIAYRCVKPQQRPWVRLVPLLPGTAAAAGGAYVVWLNLEGPIDFTTLTYSIGLTTWILLMCVRQHRRFHHEMDALAAA